MNLTCYHTLEDRGNPVEIEEKGPFECTRGDFWFGKGYYFWDTNFRWARWWGELAYREKGYIVSQATIKLDDSIFDLTGNVSHRMTFSDAYHIIEARKPPNSRELVVRDVIHYMQRTGSFEFNGIRGEHEQEQTLTVKFNVDRSEYTRLGNPVQICLINRNNLLSPTLRIVFPREYVTQ